MHRQLFFRQICKDIQDNFISLKEDCIESGIILTALMVKGILMLDIVFCAARAIYKISKQISRCKTHVLISYNVGVNSTNLGGTVPTFVTQSRCPALLAFVPTSVLLSSSKRTAN